MFLHIKKLREQNLAPVAQNRGESPDASAAEASNPSASLGALSAPIKAPANFSRLSAFDEPQRRQWKPPAFVEARRDQEKPFSDLQASAEVANNVRPGGIVAASFDDQKSKSFDALPISEQAAELLTQYRKSRVDFGMSRMRMGAFLHIIKSNRLWEGVAENFDAFIASENINSHAARQYMNVAKTFIFDMGLSEEQLSKLSIAGISALEKAAKVIGSENREEVVEILMSLSEKDAIQRIMEMSINEQTDPAKPALRVLRLLREFYEMPPDLQFDFLGKVTAHRAANSNRKGISLDDGSSPSPRAAMGFPKPI